MSDMFDYDAELRMHSAHFRAAARVCAGDHVLDIGCGTGQSTREAAHAAINGSAVGVDVSAPMLERARQLSDEQGLTNITFQQADAQAHDFPPTRFDLCISRFGTMFFAGLDRHSSPPSLTRHRRVADRRRTPQDPTDGHPLGSSARRRRRDRSGPTRRVG